MSDKPVPPSVAEFTLQERQQLLATIERLEAELLDTLVDWGKIRLELELAALKSQPSGVVLPDRFEMAPYQTVDKGSTNYKAGFNAAIKQVHERLNQQPASGGDERAALTGVDYKRKFECLVEHAKRQDRVIAEMRYDENIRRFYDDGAVWFWAGDETDNLETLACPVVINAGDLRAMLAGAPNHSEQVRDSRSEFQREERYMVVKLSKLSDDLGDDELSREEQIYRLAHFGKALVECVVVESDWPEYGPTWAAIEARVTGSGTTNQLPGGWTAKPTDDGEGFIISSPRINGVASHFSVFPDSKDYASHALWKMLAAAPSAASQKEQGE